MTATHTPRKRIRTLLAATLIGLAAVSLQAQDQNAVAQRANEAYQASNWQAARDAYAELVGLDATSGRGWYRLGVAERYLGNFAAAATALAKSQEVGVPVAFVEWEVAKLYAAQGDHDGAIEHLRTALAAGFSNVNFLETSPDFEAIRDGAAYQSIIADARKISAPCKHQAEFGQFDFWVGEWDVTDGAGVVQGSNKIERAENGCVLIENWTGAAGSTGMSMNYYDPVIGRWIQQWISGGGTQIHIEGGIEDGSMVLTGFIYTIANKTKADFRGTWTPLEDGRVRQFFEQSNDGGATWQPWFEGFYARKGG